MNVRELITRCEQTYEKLEKRQELDKESIWYGAYYDNQTVVGDALPLYISPESKYYKSPELLQRMHLHMDFLLRMQFPNGLVSLWNCNIISPPDTAFVIIPLARAIKLIEKVRMSELDLLKDKISEFLRKTIPGMSTGGFHTPNHRWVICCALAFLYERFGDEALKRRAEAFFAEGIDTNESGEWTERSNGTYNAVVDLCCYHIAEIFGVHEFYDAARGNLGMVQYMLHPGDYVATEYSTRQDRGKRVKASGYTVPYLLMAVKDRNEKFAAMAQKCMEESFHTAGLLSYLYLYDLKLSDLPAVASVEEHYLKILNAGHVSKYNQRYSVFGDTVVRLREGEWSLTLMAGQPDFMYLQYGEARAVSMKLPIGWFGLGGVSFVRLEELGERRFRLSTPIYGEYVEVLDPETVKPYRGNFLNMPYDERKRINTVETNATIDITVGDHNVLLDITVDQMPYIFTQLVIGFDREGTICGEHLETMPNGVILPKDGKLTYSVGNDSIEITGKADGHDYDLIRGDNLNRDLKNVIFNALSPKKWHIDIQCGKTATWKEG